MPKQPLKLLQLHVLIDWHHRGVDIVLVVVLIHSHVAVRPRDVANDVNGALNVCPIQVRGGLPCSAAHIPWLQA